MKFINQKDYPHLLYHIGKKMDYDYYIANKDRIDASMFGPMKFVPGMAPLSNKATVAQAGCGLCCAVMVADQLIPNADFTLEDAIDLSYACGADGGIGTEYDPFAPALAEKLKLHWKGTNSLVELDTCLEGRGVAVAKAGGDRRDGHIGVFTHGWHYILIIGKRQDGKYIILDPSLFPGKYDEAGREGLVEVNPNGDGMHNLIYASGEVILEEVKLFDPGFYMFW